MKRFGTRLAILAAGTLLATIVAILGSGSGVAQGGSGDAAAPELEGTWRVELTPVGDRPPGFPPPPYRSLQTFIRGGIVMETNQFAESVGHGVWTRLGPRKFKFTFDRLWRDPAKVTYGRAVITDEIELNAKLDEYTSVGSAVEYDAAGKVLNRYCARSHGVRMRQADFASTCR